MESKNISLPLDTERRKICRHFLLSTLCLGEDSFKRLTKSNEITDSKMEDDDLIDNKTSIFHNSQITPNENSKILTIPEK